MWGAVRGNGDGRAGWLDAVVGSWPVIVALAVALAAGLGAFALHRAAEADTQTAVLYDRLDGAVHLLRFAEGQAWRGDGAASAGGREWAAEHDAELARAHSVVDAVLAALGQADPADAPGVRAALERYLTAAGELGRLAVAGRQAEAEDWDAAVLDPAFAALDGLVEAQAAAHADRAAGAATIADAGTLASLAVATAAGGLLFRRAARASARSARAEGERLGLRASEARLREEAARLAAVVAAQEEIAGAGTDPGAVMRLAAQRARDLTGAEGAGVALLEGDAVVYRAAVGAAAPMEGVGLDASRSLTGLTLAAGTVGRFDDVRDDPRLVRVEADGADVRSLLVVPLTHDGATVGALGISSPRVAAFGDAEERVLRLLAGFLGATLIQTEAHAAERAARLAAEDAARLRRQFLSTVSHELRTPLTAVIGYAEILLAGLSGDLSTTQADDVRKILSGGEQLLGLVNDVLDLTRLESDRPDLDLTAVDPAWVAAQACADVAPQAAAKGLELTVEVPEGLPPVLGDPRRVRQVLVNLIGNAVKFTDRGRVAVGARTAGDGMVDLWVRDTGIGIAPEHLPRVFDEFFQADGSTTRRHGGTGLGLAIARRLAEAQGGTVLAKSAPGEGSTFTLVLPQAPPDRAGAGG